MSPPDTDAATKLQRLEQMIERYREEKRRWRLQRALKLLRQIEADERLAMPELHQERVH